MMGRPSLRDFKRGTRRVPRLKPWAISVLPPGEWCGHWADFLIAARATSTSLQVLTLRNALEQGQYGLFDFRFRADLQVT